MNMFVCQPRSLRKTGNADSVFDVRILERHPYTPQTFIPLGLSREDRNTYYVVIVAPTLPNKRSSETSVDRAPPYPTDAPKPVKKSLRERLLGARPNPFTNDYSATTTPPMDTSTSLRPKGSGPPDLDNIKAFIARGDQAITYGPGTWHAPMVVLGQNPIEFVVVQYMNSNSDDNCQEFDIEQDEAVIDLGSDIADSTVKARL
jgi:ureidoglycolate lyase